MLYNRAGRKTVRAGRSALDNISLAGGDGSRWSLLSRSPVPGDLQAVRDADHRLEGFARHPAGFPPAGDSPQEAGGGAGELAARQLGIQFFSIFYDLKPKESENGICSIIMLSK